MLYVCFQMESLVQKAIKLVKPLNSIEKVQQCSLKFCRTEQTYFRYVQVLEFLYQSNLLANLQLEMPALKFFYRFHIDHT